MPTCGGVALAEGRWGLHWEPRTSAQSQLCTWQATHPLSLHVTQEIAKAGSVVNDAHGTGPGEGLTVPASGAPSHSGGTSCPELELAVEIEAVMGPCGTPMSQGPPQIPKSFPALGTSWWHSGRCVMGVGPTVLSGGGASAERIGGGPVGASLPPPALLHEVLASRPKGGSVTY